MITITYIVLIVMFTYGFAKFYVASRKKYKHSEHIKTTRKLADEGTICACCAYFLPSESLCCYMPKEDDDQIIAFRNVYRDDKICENFTSVSYDEQLRVFTGMPLAEYYKLKLENREWLLGENRTRHCRYRLKCAHSFPYCDPGCSMYERDPSKVKPASFDSIGI